MQGRDFSRSTASMHASGSLVRYDSVNNRGFDWSLPRFQVAPESVRLRMLPSVCVFSYTINHLNLECKALELAGRRHDDLSIIKIQRSWFLRSRPWRWALCSGLGALCFRILPEQCRLSDGCEGRTFHLGLDPEVVCCTYYYVVKVLMSST